MVIGIHPRYWERAVLCSTEFKVLLQRAAVVESPLTDARTRPLVVILHYGAPELTERLHRQLLGSDPSWRDNILVLDNAAPLPYKDAWHRLEENLYWGGAFHWALERMGEFGHERLWFLNNDIIFASAPPHLERAWQRITKLEQSLGTIAMYSPSVQANPYHPQMVRDERRQWRKLWVMDGIAPLVHADSVARAGGLDSADNPRGYGVDIWLSLRLASMAGGLVLDHQVALRHSYHSTAKRVEGFLEQAGEAQQDYLAARMGADWRERLKALQADYRDHESLTINNE